MLRILFVDFETKETNIFFIVGILMYNMEVYNVETSNIFNEWNH